MPASLAVLSTLFTMYTLSTVCAGCVSDGDPIGKFTPTPILSTHTITTGIPQRKIHAVIESHVAEVRQCFRNSRVKQSGRMTLTFLINPYGKVTSASITESNLEAFEMENCLIAAAKTWIFPQPASDGIVMVRYPLVFSLQETRDIAYSK